MHATPDDGAWYAVHTKPKQEKRALDNLQFQGFECFLPLLEVEKVRRGKVQRVIEPMFSRYLFIRLNDTTQNWSPIRFTLGVSKLVSFGPHPAKVPVALIDLLREAPAAEIQRLFSPGDAVLIVEGPLKGLEATYQAHDGDMRAMVLVDLLGQPQKLKMALTSLLSVPQ
jgi:transcriptional antiterminator RfaH